MPSRHPRRRRVLLPAVLAAILAGEITGIALGRSLPPVVVPVAGPAAIEQRPAPDLRDRALEAPAPRAVAVRTTPATITESTPSRSRAPRTAVAVAAPAPRTSSTAPGGFHGVNHVWIPSLGITRSVQSFPCSRTRPPDAGVYRWGCAGRNNVYLLSHAWSTFRPLHDAYVRGTLRKGMRVWYADGGGRVHEYRVIWWRVTAPTTAAKWAWASLPSPGMTLQTCVGANSQYRLMVRLDRVD